MAESRIPKIPLPRPFLRVITEAPVTKEDVERVRKALQQNIDILQAELRREKELTRKLQKSAEILQEILSSPSVRALSLQPRETIHVRETGTFGTTRIDEPPVEYVQVEEIELTDQKVKQLEAANAAKSKKAED